MSWLKYPRSFRLIEEQKKVDGRINFGPVKGDITLTNWTGTIYLVKKDIFLQFSMKCNNNFPNVPPLIVFEPIDNFDLKKFCETNMEPKNQYFCFDVNKSIVDNFEKLYNAMDN